MSSTDVIRQALQETVGDGVTVQVPPQREKSISVVLNRPASETIEWTQLANDVISRGKDLKQAGQLDVNRIRVGGRISGENRLEFQKEYELIPSQSQSKSQKDKWISSPDSANPVILTIGVILCAFFYLASILRDPIGILMLALFACALGMLAKQKGRSFYKWWCYGFMIWIVAILHALLIR